MWSVGILTLPDNVINCPIRIRMKVPIDRLTIEAYDPGMKRREVWTTILPLGLISSSTPLFSANQFQVLIPAPNPQQALARSARRARSKGSFVLLIFVSQYCIWCKVLDETVRKTRALTKLISQFNLLVVDVENFDRNLDLAVRFGIDLKASGLPYFSILNAAGRVEVNHSSSVFEHDSGYDTTRISAFLEQFVPRSLRNARFSEIVE